MCTRYRCSGLDAQCLSLLQGLPWFELISFTFFSLDRGDTECLCETVLKLGHI